MSYHFGNIVVNTANMAVSKGGQLFSIEPKLFSLLIYFCENNNRAISRDELIKEVWGNRIVSEAAVNRAVAQLRKHIEVDTANPQYIHTVSKIGYKLIANVKTISVSLEDKNLVKTDKQNWSWLSYLCALFILLGSSLAIWKYTFIDHTRELKLTGQQAVTKNTGSSFNPFYDQYAQYIYYLYKSGTTQNAQIRALKDGLDEKITNDGFYYTDVISISESTLVAARLDDLKSRNCEIVSIDKRSLKIEKIAACDKSIINHLSYIPKTNKVIYRNREIASQPYGMYSISLSSLRKQTLSNSTQTSNGAGYIAYALSPKKEQLAIIEYQTLDTDKLEVIHLETKKKLMSIEVPKNISTLIWGRDDLLIANSSSQLFSIDLNNNSISKVESKSRFGRLSIIPRTMQVITEKSQVHDNLEIVNYNNNTTSYLTQLEGLIGAFSPANKSNLIIFHSKTELLERILLKKSNNQIINTNFPEPLKYTSNFIWSQNDEYVIASVNDNAYLLDVKKMEWKKVDLPFFSIHHISFIDDRNILISTEINGDWNLWSFNLKTKQVNQLTHSEAYSGRVFDNKLYFTKFSRDGLFVKELNSSREELFIKDFPLIKWREWQIKEERLLYTQDNILFSKGLTNDQNLLKIYNTNNKSRNCKKSYQQGFLICKRKNHSISNLWQIDFAVK